MWSRGTCSLGDGAERAASSGEVFAVSAMSDSFSFTFDRVWSETHQVEEPSKTSTTGVFTPGSWGHEIIDEA